ncbi:Ring hydroxylating enzyme beta subunit [Mycobacteroides abscessus]|nr:Ring hydroxylating enzyme beta subunit [Mycobacteroides abscessus]
MSLADRLAITDLLYRYAELMDAGDFDAVGELLGRGSFGGEQGSVSGASAITKLFFTTTRRYQETGGTPRTRHLVLNPVVEVAGDGTASADRRFAWSRPPSSCRCSPSWWADTVTPSDRTGTAGTSRAGWMSRWSVMCRPIC